MRSFGFISHTILFMLLFSSCKRTHYYDQHEIVKETYLHKYGVPVPAQDWASRGKDGKVIVTMKNGVEVSKSYVGGTLNGETTYSFPHSKVVEKSQTYVNNILTKEMLFYLSGAPLKEVRFSSEGGKVVVEWYESGSPKSVEEYDLADQLVQGEYYDIHHQTDAWVENREGMRVIRDAYGQLMSRDTVQEGIITNRTTYHPNGAIQMVTPFRYSQVDGILKSYLPAGEPNSIEEWVAGKQHGTTILFLNGEKFAEVQYVSGFKSGWEKHFKDGAIVAEEIYWQNGKRHGPSISHVEGVQKMEWYFEGQPVTRGNFEILNQYRPIHLTHN